MTISAGAAVAAMLALGTATISSLPAIALPIPAGIAGGALAAVVPVSSWGERVHGYENGYGYGYRHPHHFFGYGRRFGYGDRRHFHHRHYRGY